MSFSTHPIAACRLLSSHEEGQDLIEYGLLIGVITLTVVVVVKDAGLILTNMYGELLTILQMTI